LWGSQRWARARRPSHRAPGERAEPGDEPTIEDGVGHLVSVNVGRPREVEWFGRTVETAIWKAPVTGRVRAAGVNLDGDGQADLRVHGGADKAIYGYSVADYGWWSDELGHRVESGTFGENLTIDGVDLMAAVIGERWRVGSAILEVAQPRQPCFKLGIRMGDAAFVDRFDAANRLGAYLRIVGEGDVGAGDPVTLVERPSHGLRIADIAEAHRSHDPVLLAHLRDTPAVPDGWRDWAIRTLARTGARP
jgi:MOSC domain-containing protein YiiM